MVPVRREIYPGNLHRWRNLRADHQERQCAPKVVLPKNERAGTWQPAKDWVQVPLWPATTPLAKPDSRDRSEATGNGTGLVGKHKWH